MAKNEHDGFSAAKERMWQSVIMPLLAAVQDEAKFRNVPFKWECVVAHEVFYYENDGQGHETSGRRENT